MDTPTTPKCETCDGWPTVWNPKFGCRVYCPRCAESKPALLCVTAGCKRPVADGSAYLCAECAGHCGQVFCAESKPEGVDITALAAQINAQAMAKLSRDTAPVEASAGVTKYEARSDDFAAKQDERGNVVQDGLPAWVSVVLASDYDAAHSELLAAREEIARLTASERSAWNAAAIRDETIAARDARIAELEKDAKRLDWLCEWPTSTRFNDCMNKAFAAWLNDDETQSGQEDFRAAIDAARVEWGKRG